MSRICGASCPHRRTDRYVKGKGPQRRPNVENCIAGKQQKTENFKVEILNQVQDDTFFCFLCAQWNVAPAVKYATINIFVALLINAVVVFFMLKFTGYLQKLLGKGGVYFTRKFFGIVLLAISVKLFTSNLLHFIHIMSDK